MSRSIATVVVAASILACTTLVLEATLALGAQSPSAKTNGAGAIPRPDTSVVALKAQVTEIRAELDADGKARDHQIDEFSAYAQTIAIVSGALVGIFALGGVLATFLGYKTVARYVQDEVGRRVESSVSAVGQAEFELKSEELRSKWDAQFAELYNKFDELVRDAGGSNGGR